MSLHFSKSPTTRKRVMIRVICSHPPTIIDLASSDQEPRVVALDHAATDTLLLLKSHVQTLTLNILSKIIVSLRVGPFSVCCAKRVSKEKP